LTSKQGGPAFRPALGSLAAGLAQRFAIERVRRI